MQTQKEKTLETVNRVNSQKSQLKHDNDKSQVECNECNSQIECNECNSQVELNEGNNQTHRIEVRQKRKNFCKFSTHAIAKIGVLTALSLGLYAIGFALPMFFPSFLELQISELPALLAGFSMGPVAGCIIVVLKTLLKMVFLSSSSFGVGEVGDIVLGCTFVVVSWLIYKLHKNKKGAILGLIVGSVATVIVSVVINRFLLLPFYIEAFGLNGVLGLLSAIFPSISAENLYDFYLPLSVVPFNLIRCLLVSLLTFFLYKRLSKILHW